jgi:PTS system mannose-specific IIC component
MDLNIIQIILVLVVAFVAGMEGILDQFHFHQPILACTLIGLVTGHLTAGLILGGTLQMIALGWANIGAAVAPDAALASIASSLILVLGGGHTDVRSIGAAIAVAIPLAVAGLFLTMVVRTVSVALVHGMDSAAKKANFKQIEVLQFVALALQGLRIAIPAGLILAIGQGPVEKLLNSMPAWLSDGMAIGGGMVVAVGYAMVVNMMASKETWPFFALGFVLAAISEITLIGLGVIGVALALVYLHLEKVGGSGNSGGATGDPVGDIIDNY